MHELNSFKKLPAKISNCMHGGRPVLVEEPLTWHGNNGVTLCGENDGEWDGVIVGCQSVMFKQLD